MNNRKLSTIVAYKFDYLLIFFFIILTMAPQIYTLNDAVLGQKIAGFDYDWTIVNPKDGSTFPKDVDDWAWFSEETPQIIKDYHEKGFTIVIFTNQTKLWKVDQILKVCETLQIPMFVCVAMAKADHKPNPLMFDMLVEGTQVAKDDSFFVGDALGRKSDFSDSDKVFAENIGLNWLAPESVFMCSTFVKHIVEIMQEPEIIIMVGYPGSGKSTIGQEICNSEKGQYIQLKGDDFQSNTPKMIKASLEHLVNKKSIVFDATNSSTKKRALYIAVAQKYDYPVRCIHVSTPLGISYKRNKCRQDKKQVPKIAYSVYKKHFNEPLTEEGFELITVL